MSGFEVDVQMLYFQRSYRCALYVSFTCPCLFFVMFLFNWVCPVVIPTTLSCTKPLHMYTYRTNIRLVSSNVHRVEPQSEGHQEYIQAA